MALVEVLLIKVATFLVDSYFHVIENFFQKLNNLVHSFGK